MTGHDGYTIRQAAYDLRKLRGKNLILKPGHSRRYQIPPAAARTITALLTLRDQVIGPLIAGVRIHGHRPMPATWTGIDRDYEALRTDMHCLFRRLGIATASKAVAA
jgi:hypothetical protein